MHLGNDRQQSWNIGKAFRRRTHGISPDMPDTTSGAAIRRKGTPHSVAMALASAVLPQPGGPYSSTPLGGCTPNHAYICTRCSVMHAKIETGKQLLTEKAGQVNSGGLEWERAAVT